MADELADAGPVRPTADGVTVALSVRPRARRAGINGIAAAAGGAFVLRVSVTAPPEDGKANAAVIALLATAWRVPKRAVTVIRGAASRRKTVRVEGDPRALGRVILAAVDVKESKRDG